jgi:hypothetical protein
MVMKHRVIAFAGLLALLAVLGRFYATPLLAQVRAALVQNVDDPGRIAYQSAITGLTSQICQPFCTFNFSPVPNGYRLVVQHVSGSFIANGNSNSASVLLFGATPSGPNFQSVNFFVPAAPAIFGGGVAFDQPVITYFDSGRTPQVSVSLSGGPSDGAIQQMNVYGYLLNCTTAPCAAIAH